MVRVKVWLEEQKVERIQSFTVLMLKKFMNEKVGKCREMTKKSSTKEKKIDVPFTLSLKHLFIM